MISKYFIEKKSEYHLTVVLFTLFFSSIMLLFHIFIDKNVVFRNSELILSLFCSLSLYFLRKGELEKSININIFAYIFIIFIEHIFMDLISTEDLTHYHVLMLITVLIVGFIVISLISIRRYQSLIVLYFSCLFTVLNSAIIYLKYYRHEISVSVIGNFILYILLILGGCIFCNLLLKMNAEAIEIADKHNKILQLNKVELERMVKDRTNELSHLVYYDALTGLSNRKKLQEDIDILLDKKDVIFAFLFIDLNKFKSINDNYGHLAGDHILINVAVRLRNIISPPDEVYRIGGDEFIVILRDLKSTANAEKVAVAIGETLMTAFTYKENQLFIGASIGISIFPEHGIDEDTLSKKADLAMYEVKRKGDNGYMLYSSEMKKEDSDKL